MSEPKDSRRLDSPRVVFSAQVELTVPDSGRAQWFTKNLSPHGIFVQTSEPLPVGMNTHLIVRSSDGEELFQVDARVVWTRPDRPGSSVVSGMGLVFTDVTEASRTTIEKICEVNPPEHRDLDGLFEQAAEEHERTPDPSLPGRRSARRHVSDLILGIDLGTTYSCSAYVEGKKGRPVIVPTDTYNTLPSVVAITDNVIVGQAAVDMMATNPESVIYGHKRLLGRRFASPTVQDARERMSYEIVPDEAGDAAVRVDGKIYTMAWLSSAILREMVSWAEHHMGERVSRAVITVPAYYTDRQRQAVLRAAGMAGLDVLQIVNEPTAAAVAYGIDRGYRRRVLVYDLGGGTFDVSILQVNGNVFEVLTTGGDLYLGGMDFDRRIADWLISEFERTEGIDLSEDPAVRARLRQASEKAKRDLSELTTVRVNLPYVARRGNEVVHLDMELTRERMNHLVRDLVERTMDIAADTLQRVWLSKDDIDEVIMVGGQTNTHLVQGAVRSFFEKIPRRPVHPDEAMALGAAVLGDASHGVETIVLLDVVTSTIGVGLPGDVFKPLLAKDTTLPAVKEYRVLTREDNVTHIEIPVYQGTSEVASQNDYLGTIAIEGLPPRPAGEIEVDVHFEVDRQGFLRVTTSNNETGDYRVIRLITRDAPGSFPDVVPAGTST